MSRWEFMRQLEELLSDISPNEREEALQYYNDYFNDAGRENEQEVIQALGSPRQVAKIVKDGLSENGSQGEFTETGFTSTQGTVQNAVARRRDDARRQDTDPVSGHGGAENNFKETEKKSAESKNEKKEPMPVWAVILIVIGCVLLSPILLSAICAVGGALLGIIAAALGVIFGFGVAALVLYVLAATFFIAGFGCILVHPAAGIGLLGGGCICMALGILFMLLVGFLAGKCIPGICQGIAYIFRKLFGGKGGARE